MRLRVRESLLYGLTSLIKAFDRRPTTPAAFDPARVRNILLVSSTALGDTVLSTAAIAATRRSYPMARITALIDRDYVELMRRMPQIDHVIPYYGGYRRFFSTLAALRGERFDLALILHGNEPQATPLAYLAGARFIFKLPNTSQFRFLLANPAPVLTWAELGHGMAQRLRVAALAGVDTNGARLQLPIANEEVRAVDAWLGRHGVSADTRLIGMQLGASSRGRMWPAENFVAAARTLAQDFPGARVLLTGSPAEAAMCGEVAQAMGAATLNAAGELPLTLLPALVRRLAVLVTGDTGTLHVAVAVGTPTVSLFAVSDPARSGPAQDPERHHVIHSPCTDPGTRSKTDDQAWIARISVAEVVAAVASALRGESHG